MEIKFAKTAADILSCFDAMHELRPQLTKETIVDLITGMMSRGYQLIYIEENGTAVSAAGYRYTEHLHWGKVIYIDDLTSLPAARKKGHARLLLDFIAAEAKRNNCNEVHLDSGCGPHRYDAHRLYLRYGFNITSFHFARKV